MTPVRRAPLLVLVVLVLGGCRLEGLQFREEEGFTVLHPRDRSETALPVELRWTRPEDESDLHHFAVFVDRPPMARGRGLDELARADHACVRRETCPSEAYLEAEQIYLSRRPIVTIAAVARRLDVPSGFEDVHEATVVLLDADLRRIGEQSASVQFRLVRDGERPGPSGGGDTR